MSSDRFCIKCGNKIDSSDKHCIKCGTPTQNEDKPLMEPLVGRNGQLIIFRDFVEIDRSSSKVFSLMAGLYGKKRLYYRDIGSIQFKKTGLAVGFIQFSLLGGRDSKGLLNTTQNENAVTFGQDNDKWEQGYNFIRRLIDEYKERIAKPIIQNAVSNIDELTKASNLLEKGFITQEEFNQIKQKILSK